MVIIGILGITPTVLIDIYLNYKQNQTLTVHEKQIILPKDDILK
jgi:hypothetical protein